MCLAVTCRMHFWQNDQDVLHTTVVTQGWNGYHNKSAHKVDPGEENSPHAPVGTLTQGLLIMSLSLYQPVHQPVQELLQQASVQLQEVL